MSNWDLNDVFPLSMGQEFDAPGAEWSQHWWGGLASMFIPPAGNVVSFTGSGGAVSGAAGLAQIELSRAGASGPVVGGGAQIQLVIAITGTGGPTAGGASDIDLVLSQVPQGGGVTGGSAGLGLDLSRVGAGGAQAGGGALVEVVHPQSQDNAGVNFGFGTGGKRRRRAPIFDGKPDEIEMEPELSDMELVAVAVSAFEADDDWS